MFKVFKKKNDFLNYKIDRLIEMLEKSNINEFVHILGSKKEIIWRNILAGIFRGIGIGIGVTIITAILILTYVTGRSGYDRDGSFSTKKEDRWQMFDAGIAAQTFCLVAHEKGLGTVIQGYFDEEAIRKVVEIPEDQEVAALIPLGYPDIDPEAPPRKDASKLLTFK